MVKLIFQIIFLLLSICLHYGTNVVAEETFPSNAAETERDDSIQQDCGCGHENMPESARIIGGKVVNPANRFPWMVLIYNNLVSSSSGIATPNTYCGGALITRQHVLTAAHCFKEIPGEKHVFTVAIGTNEVSSRVNAVPIAWYKFFKDKRNAHKNLNDDIAIIKLEEPVVLGDNVGLVCLPPSRDFNFSSNTAILPGWGHTSYPHGHHSKELKYAEFVLISQVDCERQFGIRISGHVLCVASTGDSACLGDSGGPLVVKHQGSWVEIGLTSFGKHCGTTGLPTVFTKVARYLKWIEYITKGAPTCKA